jgi:Leucine-rich repeat (LRR) protein
MKRNKLCAVTVSLVFMMAISAVAQKSKPQKPAKKAAAEKTAGASAASGPNEEKVKDVVAFFQLLLNTLGSNASSARDKDIVITESYAKIFRDDKVQVEDDLDENRSVITNKDIVAYLKDVDFFFEDVTFELAVEDIEEGVNANGQVFYKVSLRRTLEGTTASGKKVKNTIPRYIEINYDAEAEDLRIASVYTNEFDEKEALTNWWSSLSLEWQTIFKRKLNIIDTVGLNDIKDMRAIDELDLSGNDFIQSIEPVGQLISLKLLNLAGTQVSDLTPMRNLTELVELDLSRTKVFDLSALRYASKLLRLSINGTEIRSVAVLENMPNLQNLEMQFTHVIDFHPVSRTTALINLNLAGTQIADLSPVAALDHLMELNISKTPVQDLSPLKVLHNLVSLDIDSTLVRDIKALSGLENLEVLYANYTFISDLTPLQNLPNLQRVYCDQTPVKKPIADAFMTAKPTVLVIFDSKDLRAWWNTLPEPWQRILSQTADIGINPRKEELARVTNLDSINFSNDRSITTLEPLHKLEKLKVIVANNTAISSLSPLGQHRDIRYLDISDTEVADLAPVSKFSQLEILRADRSKIEKMDPLFGLKRLREVYVDRTTIHDITAREFLQHNPGCLIVYKTIHLDRWWQNLSDSWQKVFRSKMVSDTTATRENLHRLVEQETFHFGDAPVHDLSVLGEFVRLKDLHFSATRITQIPDMQALQSLKSLHATNSPLQQIGAIALLGELEDLDISNTPIDDLRGLENMERLKSFNCAGTQIKKLDPLQSLHQLQSLDCSNTNVKKLDPVTYLSLRTLKCYNTRVTSREIDQFRENNPECEVIYYR